MAYLIEPIRVDNWDNYKQYRRLYRFRLFRGRHYRLKACLPHLAFALAMLLAAVAVPLRAFNILVYTLAGFAVLAYLGYLAIARVVPDGECLRAAAPRDSFCRYVFGNDGLQIISGRERHGNPKADWPYGEIHRVYELRDVFYVFRDKKQAVAVEKGLFTAGTPAALRRFLAGTLGGRYVVVEGPPLRDEAWHTQNKGADL